MWERTHVTKIQNFKWLKLIESYKLFACIIIHSIQVLIKIQVKIIMQQPTASMNNLCYLIKRLSLFPACVIYSPFVALSIFIVLSNFFNRYLFYVIYAPFKCTCTSHRTTKRSLPSYRAHALYANTPFQLNRRLGPSCHSDVGGVDAWLGVFYYHNQIRYNHQQIVWNSII